MEQKKLLWIIFSAVGFILIVGVVGSVLFWPKDGERMLARGGRTEEARESAADRQFDPIEWVQTDEEHPGIMEPETEDTAEGTELVIGEAGTETRPDELLNGGKDIEILSTKDIEIEVYKPEPRTEAPAPSRSAAEPSEPAPRIEKVKEYWIQTGSYASKFRAEEVKNLLAQKGIVSIITTTAVDDSTYYRVRIGPYGGEDEAEKFLEWIQGVSGFETSYVSMVYVKKR